MGELRGNPLVPVTFDTEKEMPFLRGVTAIMQTQGEQGATWPQVYSALLPQDTRIAPAIQLKMLR